MRVPIVLALSALAACSTTTEVSESPPPPDGSSGANGADEPSSSARTGVLVPAEVEAISFWPQAYRGELLVLEVLPQGAAVTAGDVLATLDTRAIEEAVRGAELEVASTLVKHEGLVQKNQMAEEAAASRLERAQASLARARRSLEGWRSYEVAFSERGSGVTRARQQSWLEDQRDELDQLQKMYEADELTDATEEIVLKRSKRDLALTEVSNALSSDRRAYQVEYTEAMQTEQKEEAVLEQEEKLDHLVRTQALDRAARLDAEALSAVALEKKRVQLERLTADLEAMTLRAPRDGILLHGRLRDYRPGGSPQQLERGSVLGARKDVLMVADPERLAVALDLPESLLAEVSDGSAVVVRPLATRDVELRGTLEIGTYPRSLKGGESLFEGLVELAGTAPGLVIGMHTKVEPVPQP